MSIGKTTRAIVIFFAFFFFLTFGITGILLAQTDSLSTAKELFRQHRWAEAATAFAECEQKVPGKTDALLYRGKSLVNLGQFDDAAVVLGGFKQTHPRSDDAIYLLAYVRFRQNKPEESLQLFTDAAKLRNPTADDLKFVALDYVLLQDYADAAHYLEVALTMDPANVEARYHLGRVRYQQNRFDLAIAAFEDVLQRDPRHVKAQDNLGLSLEAENKVDDAIVAYRKAIILETASTVHDEQPYSNLGTLLAKSNRLQETVPLLVHAVEIAPKSGKIRYELSKAYFGLNQTELARQEAEQAVSLEPNNSSYHYLLGRIYQHLGKSDLAQQQFQKTENMIHDKDAQSGGGMATGMSPN